MSNEAAQPGGSEPTTWWRPALAAAGVVAIVAGGAYVVDRSRDGSPTDATGVAAGAGGDSFDALIVHDGDPVTARGVIVEEPGQPRLVCVSEGSDDVLYPPGEEPPSACSPIAVRLTGDEDLALPSWVERDGVWFTQADVIVAGRWRDGAIEVASVTPTPDGAGNAPTYDETWRVPCDPPAGGWADGDGMLSEGMAPEDYERGTSALAEELAAHPETYHSNWVGYPDGDPVASEAPMSDMGEPMFDHQVMIVSTVDDPAEIQARLTAVYPGNLCVTRVEHSSAELSAVVQRLATPDGSWQADADNLSAAVNNDITFSLPVLDEAAVERIGSDAALLEVWPLVRPF